MAPRPLTTRLLCPRLHCLPLLPNLTDSVSSGPGPGFCPRPLWSLPHPAARTAVWEQSKTGHCSAKNLCLLNHTDVHDRLPGPELSGPAADELPCSLRCGCTGFSPSRESASFLSQGLCGCSACWRRPFFPSSPCSPQPGLHAASTRKPSLIPGPRLMLAVQCAHSTKPLSDLLILAASMLCTSLAPGNVEGLSLRTYTRVPALGEFPLSDRLEGARKTEHVRWGSVLSSKVKQARAVRRLPRTPRHLSRARRRRGPEPSRDSRGGKWQEMRLSQACALEERGLGSWKAPGWAEAGGSGEEVEARVRVFLDG